MRHRTALLLALVLPALLSCGGGGGGVRNVLFITLDTTRSDYIGCYGAANASTPTLDRLASEGARFARCAASVPLTAPSHSSIFTGTYPFVHGVRENGTVKLGAGSVTLAELLKDSGFATHGIVACFVLGKQFGLGQGFDTYLEPKASGEGGWGGLEWTAGEVVDRALEILSEPPDTPFLLWAHFYDPHVPYISRRDPNASPEAAYADEIAYMDGEIGRLIDELKKKGLERNTLVVVVGDHGEGLGDHEEREHGFFLYETSTSVPLLLRCPGTIAAGRTVEAQVRTIDLLPTVLDYLGKAAPAGVQGTSLRPLVDGKEDDLGIAAYGESVFGNRLLGLSNLYFLQENGWKYIHSSKPELYYLPDDPSEERNLIGEQTERADRMRSAIETLLAEGEAAGAGEDRSVELSAEERRKLEELGYAVPAPAKPGERPEAGLQASGESPVDYPEIIGLYLEARHQISDKRFEEAAASLRTVVLALPEAPLPRGELSAALRRIGRGDEIFEVGREALAAHPDAFDMRTWLARELFRAGRANDALPVLEAAIARDPKHGAAHGEYAGLLQAIGRTSDARAEFEQALALGERTPAVLRGLAVIREADGKEAEAAELIREALEKNPDSEILKRDLARLEGTEAAPGAPEGQQHQ
ncbi:MAG: hypothetical protein EHM19_12090, partial [Candidatus Latescibacterota bacterium]